MGLITKRGITRIQAVLVVAIVIIAAVVAAFALTPRPTPPATATATTSAQTSPSTTSPTTTVGTAQPPAKNVLVVAMGTDIVTLDPHDATDNPSEMVNRVIYEGLVEFDENLNIRPSLAERWEIRDGGSTYVFYLRKGVYFQDGTPFNATAVKLNFERLITQNLKRSALFQPYIESVEVIDEYTVAFHLKSPFGAFLHHLAHGAALIISPKVLSAGEDPKDHPVGTGPYMFKEWVRGDHVTLVANPNYWRKDVAPKFDEVVIKVVPDDKTRERLLEAGDVDIALRIPPADVERLNASGNLIVYAKPTIRVIYIGFNVLKYPFNDTRIRQAFNYAIDKEAIVKTILKGLGAVADSPLAPNCYGYCPVGPYPYDPEKAKKLLAEAGWVDRDGDGILENEKGEELVVNLWTPRGRYVGDYEIAQAVQLYLSKVGVKVNLQVWEWAAYLAETRKPANESKVEMFLLGWAPSTGDGDWVLRPLFASWMWVPVGENRAFYANPQVDDLIKKQMQTVGEERLKALCEAQKLIFNDAPWIFLVVMYDTIGVKPNVKGFVYLPIEIVLLKYAYRAG